jgi:hypothetical protein
MTVLVPGLHLLDAETYAVAGAGSVFERLRTLDSTPERKPAPVPARVCIYRGVHRAR